MAVQLAQIRHAPFSQDGEPPFRATSTQASVDHLGVQAPQEPCIRRDHHDPDRRGARLDKRMAELLRVDHGEDVLGGLEVALKEGQLPFKEFNPELGEFRGAIFEAYSSGKNPKKIKIILKDSIKKIKSVK